MRGRRHELAAGGALVVAAVGAWALVPTYPSYDSQWALVWGRELLGGELPSYDVYAAPTPHPLWTVTGAACALLGTGGDRALVLVSVLALVALAWGVARLGTALWDLPRGLLAAVLVGSSTSLGLYAAKAYVDVPFVALVAWAAALEVERPRRGWPVAALLALAGLLRPEGWLLAVAYWLFLGAARRGALVTALTVAAPVLWALSDLVVTGDPLFSLHRTEAVVESIGEEVRLAEVPRALVSFLAGVLRPPVLVLGALGIVLALRGRRWREVAIPLALLGVGVAAFAGGALFALTAQQRYLTVPAVALGLFAAHALLGFRDRRAGDPWRRRWVAGVVAASVVALAGGAVLLPGTIDRLRTELRFVRDSHDQLEALLARRAVARCRPIVFPTYKGVPDALWVLDADPGAVVAAPALGARKAGARVYVGPGDRPIRRFGIAAGVAFDFNRPDPRLPVFGREGPFEARGECT